MARVAAILVCSLVVSGLSYLPAAEAATTVCAVTAEQPHDSGHFSGRINAIGKVSCFGDPLADMHLDVQVQRKVSGVWKVVATTRVVLDHKPLFIRISRSLPCVTGNYRTRARAFAYGRHHTWARSAARIVACGSGGGGGGGGGGSW
jgi:hypothetical protein